MAMIQWGQNSQRKKHPMYVEEGVHIIAPDPTKNYTGFHETHGHLNWITQGSYYKVVIYACNVPDFMKLVHAQLDNSIISLIMVVSKMASKC
jgi:hypothetical protein